VSEAVVDCIACYLLSSLAINSTLLSTAKSNHYV